MAAVRIVSTIAFLVIPKETLPNCRHCYTNSPVPYGLGVVRTRHCSRHTDELMSLLVLAYPEIDDKDRLWLQSLRAEYDERYYGVVEAHFTLVFPTAALNSRDLIVRVRDTVNDTQAVRFVLRCALVVPDEFSDTTHVFLVPDEGFSQIVKLHDRLYDGPLASELRLDIPYLPHVGVGNSGDAMRCKQLADELNREGFELEGWITTLDVAQLNRGKVTTLTVIPL